MDARSPATAFPDVAPEALLALVRAVRATGYGFTTVTPSTHARVNARPEAQQARSLRDVLGWSRPFASGLLPPDLVAALEQAGAVARDGAGWRPTIRLSSLDDELFLHSAYPPSAPDAVFFGPDTLRFVSAVLAHLAERRRPVRRAVDIGCGSGAAGICVAKRIPEAEVALVDINPAALRAAAVNAEAAGIANVRPHRSDMLEAVSGEFDLIISNPPFMIDHGGGPLGAGLSLRVVEAARARLAPGGSLVLFTGAAIVEGEDPFRAAAGALCAAAGLSWDYREFDPDAYGEELDDPAYAKVERIALVVLTATRP
ncbi:SAM-dependent methyltransferase [Methylobacterium sp. Leaf104]|uniref:methyltransferase n=1 Tax=Methylobacterium TaxID=407 RepID=UPI0006F26914|nr:MULTISPECIES: class I SAM-dependent methyltransferase [Methylobacterium]KQP31278.1 SAM-dependent methyltransferase [Methylobacterium sp. Leaf104]MCI9881386.1 class I SAM-dependent methyltransferase [Methylobacterium goesingense]